jgi:hypothetical protein
VDSEIQGIHAKLQVIGVLVRYVANIAGQTRG